MPRRIELNKKGLSLTENEIEGFLERVVTPVGTSAKADVPKRYIGRRVYVIITKEKENTTKE
jgi:putative transposon-encoded protein